MGWDTERFPEPEEMIKELNKKNIHLSLWKRLQIQSFCVLAWISQIRNFWHGMRNV